MSKKNGAELVAGPYMQTLIAEAKKVKKKNIVVVYPDEVALSAINNAINESIIEHVFMIDDKKILSELIINTGADKSNYTLIEPQSDSEVAATLMAIEIIKAKKAHMIMKGKLIPPLSSKVFWTKRQVLEPEEGFLLSVFLRFPGLTALSF